MKPQTSVWLQTSAGLVAWLWLAPVAEAQPTYTAIPLDHPTPQADARFAGTVAGIGDVNGDGRSDFLVGAPFQTLVGNLNQGRAFVFSGADRSLLFTLDHPAPQGLASFGSAVAVAGDVNRDGRPDLLVGAPGQRVGGRANQGQAYVLSSADGRLLLTLDNPIPQADAAFGAAVAGAGDVNGDGAPDLLVGAPEQDPVFLNEGQAFVFSGTDGRLLLTLDDPTPQGAAAFGAAVAGIGDVNRDGRPDLLVGHRIALNILVFSGADGSVLRTLDNLPGITFRSDFGSVMAGIGDVNGDSVPDVLVGAPGDVGSTGDQQGRAFVFSGADASLLRTLDLPNPPGGQLTRFGSALSAAGDVNGDGVPDVLVGAPGLAVQGQAFVFSGTDASVLLTLDVPTPDSSARFGAAVAGIGDVDGDGAPDFLVGAPGQDVGGRARQGRAFVFVSAPVPPGPAEAELATPPQVPVRCTGAACRPRIRCNLAQVQNIPCSNPIDLFAFVPRRALRLSDDSVARAPRRIRFAFGIASVPPSDTATVRLRLTPRGRRIFNTSRAKNLNGVLAIRNAAGTVIDTTPVRIRLRRR